MFGFKRKGNCGLTLTGMVKAVNKAVAGLTCPGCGKKIGDRPHIYLNGSIWHSYCGTLEKSREQVKLDTWHG